MAEKKGRKPDYSGEEKGRTVVEIRWRDCFKFWVTHLIVFSPAIVLLLMFIAATA